MTQEFNKKKKKNNKKVVPNAEDPTLTVGPPRIANVALLTAQ